MTNLSINLNKIALLRNARGRDVPNVVNFAKKFISLGAQGITIHPRPDERHITIQDALELSEFLKDYPHIEFNIEGYPTETFLLLVEQTKPTQCTLVPDTVEQITSDHGWDLSLHQEEISNICKRLSKAGIRTSLFLDPVIEQVQLAQKTGTERIELYTEAYASTYGKEVNDEVLEQYQLAAKEAEKMGLGVNAGHDLNAENLAKFLTIGNILEVSIGHALTVECIEEGMNVVLPKYLNICNNSST